MIFLVLEARKNSAASEPVTVQAWIRTASQEQARTIAEQKLGADNCSIINIIECTRTTPEDYFPPCKSMDAYLEADQLGFALRYS